MNIDWTVGVLVAGVPTIAALGAVWIGIKNSGQLIKIHTLANSTLSAVKASLEVSQTKIEQLEKQLLAANEAKRAVERIAEKQA